MKTIKYFSYGSNMLTERLQKRCPSARPLGYGEARGYEINFSKRSKDGSGKATPRRHSDNSSLIYGILFEISRLDLPALDRAEGKGYGYDRLDDFPVYHGEALVKTEVTTYMVNAKSIDMDLKPYDWYLSLLIAGAQQHKLPAAYIENLRVRPFIADHERDRKGYRDAIKALKQAGIDDFHTLLGVS